MKKGFEFHLVKDTLHLLKDNTRIKPVYILYGNFYYEVEGDGSFLMIKTGDRTYRLGDVVFQIEKDFDEALLYRGIPGDRLEQILSNGHDIPKKKKGDMTFATNFVSKALEHLVESRGITRLDKDACIILYSKKDMQKGDGYEVTFSADPIDALRGVILLKVEGTKSQ